MQIDYESQKGPLGYKLAKILWKLGPAYSRWVEERLKKSGTTPHRLRVIRLLSDLGPLPMKKLADEVGVTSATMTGLIDALEADGRVRRISHPADRRISLIQVTESTREKFSSAIEMYQKNLSLLFDIFTEKEKEDLFNYLSRIEEALSKEEG
jgi:DNA-binding MarR family transcriptional regulator